MCGVAGIISKNKNFFTQNKINKFLKIMRFRGPDSNGHVLIKNKNYNINLFHSRLKIIDPNINASQPMEDSEGIIIFNGMIYNFMEIKKKFFNNEIFKTNSDTEVLLKFVNKFGHSKLHLLDGMWAFAYFNKRTKTFFLSRDRFGEKPLFFYKSKNTISFMEDL
jgi:asparagine synthase (glutamine-hydrolysing)